MQSNSFYEPYGPSPSASSSPRARNDHLRRGQGSPTSAQISRSKPSMPRRVRMENHRPAGPPPHARQAPHARAGTAWGRACTSVEAAPPVTLSAPVAVTLTSLEELAGALLGERILNIRKLQTP